MALLLKFKFTYLLNDGVSEVLSFFCINFVVIRNYMICLLGFPRPLTRVSTMLIG